MRFTSEQKIFILVAGAVLIGTFIFGIISLAIEGVGFPSYLLPFVFVALLLAGLIIKVLPFGRK
jgi:hypothetical protein